MAFFILMIESDINILPSKHSIIGRGVVSVIRTS